MGWEVGSSVYFVGADATLSVAPKDKYGGTAGTAILLAVVRGWNASVKFESKPLYAMDTIRRIAIARCKCRVEGNIKFSEFDPTVASWWVAKILSPTLTTTDGTVEDTSYHKFFDLTGVAKPNTGSTDLELSVGDARFDSVPFSVEEHEWVALDMPFVGAYVDFPVV